MPTIPCSANTRPKLSGPRIFQEAAPFPFRQRASLLLSNLVDADGDGMADDWEAAYGVDDPDADSATTPWIQATLYYDMVTTTVDKTGWGAGYHTGEVTVAGELGSMTQDSPQQVVVDLWLLDGEACPDFLPPASVNVQDIVAAASRWNTTSADPDWEPRYDWDNDNDIDIDIVDIMVVTKRFGDTCP